MSPFDGLTNAHGMSRHYTDYYYSYTQRPSAIQVPYTDRLFRCQYVVMRSLKTFEHTMLHDTVNTRPYTISSESLEVIMCPFTIRLFG